MVNKLPYNGGSFVRDPGIAARFATSRSNASRVTGRVKEGLCIGIDLKHWHPRF
jgi:hypothetical protein